MKEKRNVVSSLSVYLKWPLLVTACMVAMCAVVTVADVRAGAIAGIFAAAVGIFSIMMYVFTQRSLLAGIMGMAADFARLQSHVLGDMQVPYCIVDHNGHFVWRNRAFAALGKGDKAPRKTLSSFFGGLDRDRLAKVIGVETFHMPYRDADYRIEICPLAIDKISPAFLAGAGVRDAGGKWEPVEAGAAPGSPGSVKNEPVHGAVDAVANASGKAGGAKYFVVYLFDETELLRCEQEISDIQLVVGLIYLDNYEEALESVEEVRYSMLMALVDRRITKYITGMGGVVKKTEKDKYFFVMQRQHVKELEESGFSLLEDVKAVNIGNEMAITLSIGLGMGDASYLHNYEYARTAIDMALGRGGDQAVVKDAGRIEYFGGKSPTTEKMTRVKARVKAHALRELIETKDRLLIMGHRLSDIDAFGACVGVFRIATALNKKANIVINEVTSSVRPWMDRFLGNPDYPDDMFLTGAAAAQLADGNCLLVVCDVHRPSITDAPELLEAMKTVVVLDHHRQGAEFIDNAVLAYVEPYASSTCEMVAEMLQYVADGIKIKSPEADAMYAGIVIDTNYFSQQTGVRTFEAAAYLRRSGADITRVRKLFREDMADYQAKATAIQNMEIYRGSFAISVCPSAGIENPTIVAAQAANELLNIIGVQASVVLSVYEGVVYLSARSIDELNVQMLMEKLGGGGHRTVAGAQLPGATIDEAKERLKAVIDETVGK
ncbi:MAG: DHH family phosphoesterase [Lachnospiraceae bacterium]|jgi:c-di-AMP phosphodiesterase-like protein|nr:DHH family phosphoesterase [Lachnospiraceae bacterium]